jgi:hypothetical protein
VFHPSDSLSTFLGFPGRVQERVVEDGQGAQIEFTNTTLCKNSYAKQEEGEKD